MARHKNHIRNTMGGWVVVIGLGLASFVWARKIVASRRYETLQREKAAARQAALPETSLLATHHGVNLESAIKTAWFCGFFPLRPEEFFSQKPEEFFSQKPEEFFSSKAWEIFSSKAWGIFFPKAWGIFSSKAWGVFLLLWRFLLCISSEKAAEDHEGP